MGLDLIELLLKLPPAATKFLHWLLQSSPSAPAFLPTGWHLLDHELRSLPPCPIKLWVYQWKQYFPLWRRKVSSQHGWHQNNSANYSCKLSSSTHYKAFILLNGPENSGRLNPMNWRALNPFHVRWEWGSLRAQELSTSWWHIPCVRAIQNTVCLKGVTGRLSVIFSFGVGAEGLEKEEAKGRRDVRRSNNEEQREEGVWELRSQTWMGR